MGMSCVRSLLFAAIFLSNFITWTACRHRYNHNINGHRNRHRRQGAGLFLPASYVIPGGEGSGAWGDWASESPCSRTCGGGVASRKRICLELGIDGQPLCTGGDTKYFSCQTQDCPEGSGDFRAEQCAAYNNKTFRNQIYSWLPYIKAQNPCELNCMPRGERFYYRQQLKAADGTRCTEDSFDVCVDGVCQHVGCDMMLGSDSQEDKCRRCRGNGTKCYTAKGILDSQDYIKGYNDILLIPEGATNIIIEEVKETNNYLALRAKENNVYYLNGDYHIDFPRRLRIAGAIWSYERSQQGLAAPDKLRCVGPTTEPLYVSLLLQDDNAGVEYEYSVPSAKAPPPSQKYDWVYENFSECSVSCGGGIQERRVTCRSREELLEVEDALCDAVSRLASNQSCNTDACPPEWVLGEWEPCSRACGEGGSRSRLIHCQKVFYVGFPSIVADKECFDLLGPKPAQYEECNVNATCPTWFTEPWKPCDKLCGEGQQKRLVVCHQNIDGRIETYGDEFCSEEKPESVKSCMLHPCDGVDWVLSDWTGCDTCLSTNRTRRAHCATKAHVVVASELCAYHRASVLSEPCDRAALPPCQYLWYATQWGKCSAECGNGTQARRVFCGRFDGASVSLVDDEKCDATVRYNDTKDCFVPIEKCPAKWFAGPWSECTKVCGGGERYRRVMCLSDGREVLTCDELSVLDSTQSCNTQPCNGDEILPVDATSKSIVDDEEEGCVPESDEYPEENVELPVTEDGIEIPTLIPDFIDVFSTDTEGSGSWSTLTASDTDYPITGSGLTEIDITYSTESTETSVIIETSGTESTTSLTDEIPSLRSESPPESTVTDMTVTTEDDTIVTGSTETSVVENSSTEATDETESIITTDHTTEGVTTESSAASELTSIESTKNIEITGTSEMSTTNELETSSTNSTVTDEIDTTGSILTTEVSSSTDIKDSTSEESTESVTEETLYTTEVTDIIIESADTSSSSPTESEMSTVSTEISTEKHSSTLITEITEFTSETLTTEASTLEASTSEASTSEASTSEASTSEASTSEASTSEASTSEASTSEASTSEASTSEASTSEASTSEASTSETSTSEASTSEASTSEASTSDASTTESDTTLLSTTESGLTEFSTTEHSVSVFNTTEPSTTQAGASESSITESSTTQTGVSESSTTELSTTQFVSTEFVATESSTSESGTTEFNLSESEPTSESSSETSSSYSTMSESTESSTTVISTVFTESTSTSEGSILSETSETAVTTEISIESSTTDISTTESMPGMTPWIWTKFVIPPRKKCKPKKAAKCAKSKFGCCPDKRTPAAGPFDEGCPNPETCTESFYGCCQDGVSAAAGPKFYGCPHVPCAATLYGCCRSDNITAAEGNHQDGCPISPPACRSSKFNCCQDDVTEAKGPEYEGCPETVTETEMPTTTKEAGCEFSEFGCCYDNETDASGPKGEACPCSITEFGCCPDGISVSRGPNLEGCVMTCKTSAYGCCPDGETPAHGPDSEGCCLQSPFGCCPDNYKAAEGPHLEGCGCQHSHFGCCPDNVTIARGPNSEGCGCQYSRFGCCPDRYTVAEGPAYQGCGCHTYQFGCCADGVTVSTSLNQQDCLCEQGRYGCCGDGVTPAQGPNMEGCNCASSKYGCCPDGVSESKGRNFLNCTDALKSRQAACGLDNDRGSCHNYTVHWFYDVTYGGCSRFWYSGCEGNGNRFVSQAECQDVCVHPAPKDVCQLPKVKGACSGYNVRWYYDANREQCSQFVYGGCLGNDNNFESQELCQQRCEPERTKDQCQLPLEEGPCEGQYSRWAYSGAGRCVLFDWGGCGGNANRFSSEAACLLRCAPPGEPLHACSLKQEAGNCTEAHPVWSFSTTENRCVPFYYTGCEGNDNRFDSEESCIQACPVAHEREMCTLPANVGDCAEYSAKWFYDTSISRCRQFYYGGCGGNENNFDTETECENACIESETITLQPKTLRPSSSTQLHIETTTQSAPVELALQEFCLLEVDQGPCTKMETRWAYDSSQSQCRTFDFGGCGGNRNNFPSLEYCSYYCPSSVEPVPETKLEPMPAPEPKPEPEPESHTEPVSTLRTRENVCKLPMITGPCDQSLTMFFYNASGGVCSQFAYGGCEGNDNRFNSREECERQCLSQSTTPETYATSTATTAPEQEQLPRECRVSSELVECEKTGTVWFLDPGTSTCKEHINRDVGHNCRNGFPSEETCERLCGTFRHLEVCRYEKDRGPCKATITKFYYNAALERCDKFIYGGCIGSPNRFSSIEECEQICQPQLTNKFAAERDPCSLPPETGNCLAGIIMWYYNPTRDDCEPLVYGGCGGNENRFSTKEMCLSRCKTESKTTVAFTLLTERTTPTALTTPTTLSTSAPFSTTHEMVVEGECSPPPSLSPCGENVTAFYFDVRTQACLTANTGACRHRNNYKTEEECERRCGAFVGIDVCGSPSDAGPCLAEVPKFYFDAQTGLCLPYTYGGCGGGPNRFSTAEECKEVCGNNGPDETSNEVLPECDRYVEECVSLRCDYGVQRTRTALGCERCTCVPVDVDCTKLRAECESLTCTYGKRRTTSSDGCERCTCLEHPCAGSRCADGERCVALPYRDPISLDVRYTTECRLVNKTGVCPAFRGGAVSEAQCRRECNDDADCLGVGKCCSRGCSNLCLEPDTASHSPASVIRPPELPQAPSADVTGTEPEVRANEGGKATLRCLFHGNPPPTITWRWGSITIESDTGRYRLLSDGSLDIVSLYRNDSGVYICMATNELGRATQEIRLEVEDPVDRAAGIAGEPNKVVIGELGQPLSLRCLSYGYPPPSIYWYHGRDGPMVPYTSKVYEARDNGLLISKLTTDTLGEYICQAYNGIDSPAEWSVVIQAYKTDDSDDHPYLVSRREEERITPVETLTDATTTPEPRIEMSLYTVPVSTRILSELTRIAAGAEINLPCEVDGYPLPAVHWTKDSMPLHSDDRISATDARLTILRAQSNDSGVYGCHAANAYSSQYSTVAIKVEGLYIPPNCKDNPYFATCHLIVQSKFCQHKYYSGFCCKSCVEAGQLDPNQLSMQSDAWVWN